MIALTIAFVVIALLAGLALGFTWANKTMTALVKERHIIVCDGKMFRLVEVDEGTRDKDRESNFT